MLVCSVLLRKGWALLRQEKDEARLAELFSARFDGCLHSPFCRSLKVFYFQAPHWSPTQKCAGLRAGQQIERSVRMFEKYKYIMALALAGIPSAFGNFADPK